MFPDFDAVDLQLTEEDLLPTRIMRPTRVLVVEDNEPFSRLISRILEQERMFEVVATVSDGVNAVHTAEVLQPDLILLDIGLPKQNGIAAARQICELSPGSKILFVTQESSPSVIKYALELGAWGYVLKSDAPSELLAAVGSVLQGNKFLSTGCRQVLHHGALSSPERKVHFAESLPE